jgi:DNA-binding NarL/FixJ family response regulator
LHKYGAEQLVVLIVCRVRLFCDALVSLLSRHRDIRAVGTVKVSAEAIPELDSLTPDAVLLDMGSPGSLPFATALVRARPRTRVLGFGVEDVPMQVLACAEAGLCGYVPAHASIDELAEAARRAAAGGTVCSVEMADSLFRHLGAAARDGTETPADIVLTQRQHQILCLIREGMSNKEIAQRLSLGTSTVKNHVHGLLSRLQVGCRAEAAARLDRLVAQRGDRLGGARHIGA